MKKRRMTALILLVTVVIGMFAGCNNAVTEEQSSEVSLSPIEISKENSKYISSPYSGRFVGLRKDGTVVGKSMDSDYEDKAGSLKVSNWEDIVAVSAGSSNTVGLKSDGTCVATGDNQNGQCDVYDWTDIVKVVSGGYHTVGLKSNGRVLAVGSDSYGKTNVNDWVDIVDIYAGFDKTVGLKADGTIVAVGYKTGILDWINVCGVFEWTDIVKILYLGWNEIIGLKADGTLVFAGDYDDKGEMLKRHEIMSQWEDIVDISEVGNGFIGLKSDGTLVHTDDFKFGDMNYIAFDNLNDVIAISENFLLRSNGEVLYLQYIGNKYDSYYVIETNVNLFS